MPQESPDDPLSLELSALDLLPDATIVVDAKGRLVRANRMAERLLGMRPGDSVGELAAERVPLSDEAGVDWWSHARPLEADARLLPRIPEVDLRVQTPGNSRPVTLTGSRVAAPDGGVATLVLSLRRAERRQQLDAARSDLVSTVSHELRSPLTSVKGFTKTLLAKWERFTDDQKRQMLATVNEDADRVTRLLGELLDVSRIDAGRLRLRRQMIDIAAIVDRLVDRLVGRQSPAGGSADQPSALPSADDGEGVRAERVQVDIDANVPRLYADPDKIEQVFTNLVENAMRYGRGPVEIRAQVHGDEVVCTVADDGGEIDEAHLRQLFTKFFRRSNEHHSGTGLGLYISKGIVEAHGGRIWANSAPDAGTEFHFALPCGGLELAGISLDAFELSGGARYHQGARPRV